LVVVKSLDDNHPRLIPIVFNILVFSKDAEGFVRQGGEEI